MFFFKFFLISPSSLFFLTNISLHLSSSSSSLFYTVTLVYPVSLPSVVSFKTVPLSELFLSLTNISFYLSVHLLLSSLLVYPISLSSIVSFRDTLCVNFPLQCFLNPFHFHHLSLFELSGQIFHSKLHLL